LDDKSRFSETAHSSLLVNQDDVNLAQPWLAFGCAVLALCRSVVVALLLTCPALAGAETRVALVVANAAYTNAPLGNPTFDADLIRPVLAAMGFEVTVVKDADLGSFAVALQDFYGAAKGADLALFYFAGHGFAINGPLAAQNYLMSTSADKPPRSMSCCALVVSRLMKSSCPSATLQRFRSFL